MRAPLCVHAGTFIWRDIHGIRFPVCLGFTGEWHARGSHMRVFSAGGRLRRGRQRDTTRRLIRLLHRARRQPGRLQLLVDRGEFLMSILVLCHLPFASSCKLY